MKKKDIEEGRIYVLRQSGWKDPRQRRLGLCIDSTKAYVDRGQWSRLLRLSTRHLTFYVVPVSIEGGGDAPKRLPYARSISEFSDPEIPRKIADDETGHDQHYHTAIVPAHVEYEYTDAWVDEWNRRARDAWEESNVSRVSRDATAWALESVRSRLGEGAQVSVEGLDAGFENLGVSTKLTASFIGTRAEIAKQLEAFEACRELLAESGVQLR